MQGSAEQREGKLYFNGVVTSDEEKMHIFSANRDRPRQAPARAGAEHSRARVNPSGSPAAGRRRGGGGGAAGRCRAAALSSPASSTGTRKNHDAHHENHDHDHDGEHHDGQSSAGLSCTAGATSRRSGVGAPNTTLLAHATDRLG
jgi:hypothetical protein